MSKDLGHAFKRGTLDWLPVQLVDAKDRAHVAPTYHRASLKLSCLMGPAPLLQDEYAFLASGDIIVLGEGSRTCRVVVFEVNKGVNVATVVA